MEPENKLKSGYQSELSLLRQFLMISESLVHLAEEENFGQAEEMIKRRENIIDQIKSVEKEIRYPALGAKSAFHDGVMLQTPSLPLLCRIEGIRQSIDLSERKIREVLHGKMKEISMQLKNCDTARKLLRKYTPSKKTIPKYLSCRV